MRPEFLDRLAAQVALVLLARLVQLEVLDSRVHREQPAFRAISAPLDHSDLPDQLDSWEPLASLALLVLGVQDLKVGQVTQALRGQRVSPDFRAPQEPLVLLGRQELVYQVILDHLDQLDHKEQLGGLVLRGQLDFKAYPERLDLLDLWVPLEPPDFQALAHRVHLDFPDRAVRLVYLDHQVQLDQLDQLDQARLAVAASMNVCTTMESVRSCALTPTTVTIARANLVTSLLTMPIRARWQHIAHLLAPTSCSSSAVRHQSATVRAPAVSGRPS